MKFYLYLCVLFIGLVVPALSWDWPWASSEQNGLVNTIIQKAELTPNEELKIKANSIILLLEWICLVAVCNVAILLVVCCIGVNNEFKRYWTKKLEKEVKKSTSRP